MHGTTNIFKKLDNNLKNYMSYIYYTNNIPVSAKWLPISTHPDSSASQQKCIVQG